MTRTMPSFLAVVVVSAFVVASCGSDAQPATGTTDDTPNEQSTEETGATVAPTGEEVAVLALDNNFRPEELEIDAGTAVVWENGGRNDHNIVPADGTDEWGVDVEDFAPGDVYSKTFTTPGQYPYYCTLHGTADFGMTGTIVVVG